MKLLLRWTAQAVLRRQVGKVAFLYAIDEARIAARPGGRLLHAQGVIDSPDDVAYLTVDELAGPVLKIPGIRDVIAHRMEIRSGYLESVIPGHWTGNPVLAPNETLRADQAVGQVSVRTTCQRWCRRRNRPCHHRSVRRGYGGRRHLGVQHHRSSWVPLMFLAGAVVVDIGGPMSHAAILARELGIPCVMNTIDGSRQLRDGERVRVDGSTG